MKIQTDTQQVQRGYAMLSGPYSTEKVNAFLPQIDQVLDFIGHPQALVTDDSTFADFFTDEVESVDQIMAVNEAFGCKAGMKTRLWEVARQMEAGEE